MIRVAVSAHTGQEVTSVAHLLGPKWSGLVVGFPVNGLPVIALLHARYGAEEAGEGANLTAALAEKESGA